MKTLTHSMTQCFQECRVKYDYRYNREIVPTERVPALDFGTAIHEGLGFWFRYGTADGAIESATQLGAKLGLTLEEQIKVRVMLEKYFVQYAREDFEVVEIEKAFDAPLANPKTKRASKTFRLHGKLDGIVRRYDGLWILEHKTTSDISAEYIDSLSFKPQTYLYAYLLERGLEEAVMGTIYDILEKPGIRMTKGETDEEFELRRQSLLAKSKTGKTTAKKKEAETYDEFMERCREKVTLDSFRRVEIPMDRAMQKEIMTNMWLAAKDMQSPSIYPNTGNCTKFGQVCPYINLCRAHGDLSQCPDEYRSEQAHIELTEDRYV